MIFRFLLPWILLALWLSPAASAQSTPLDKLDQLVEQLATDEEIVGAELLVVQRGETLLHRAYGWHDREAERRMQTGSVFCVRSMTKPLIGMAVMMLVEEGKVELDRPAYEYLPELDHDGLRQITVHHLLHHLGGFPMSHLSMAQLPSLTSTRQIAAMSAEHDLIYPPGTKFRYSDHGTDTLTALVEAVSGMSAQTFVEQRILQPLGMDASLLVFPEDHPLRARAVSKYVGAPGSWTRYWKASDDPLFPLFLGSQSMYATLADYRRLAELWLHDGRIGEQALLRSLNNQPGAAPQAGVAAATPSWCPETAPSTLASPKSATPTAGAPTPAQAGGPQASTHLRTGASRPQLWWRAGSAEEASPAWGRTW